MRVKYMIGARVVVVSVLPDLGRKISSITLHYKKNSDQSYVESASPFRFYTNSFKCDQTGLVESTKYNMYVSVKYADNGVDSSTSVTFDTEAYGNVSPVITSPTLAPGAADYTEKVRELSESICSDLNDVGIQYGAIGFHYDSYADTAAASYHNYIKFGPKVLKAKSEIIETCIHEMRHYFGVCHYHSSHSCIHANDGVNELPYLGNQLYRIGSLYNYSIDDVAKFQAGSDLAYICFCFEHSNTPEGSQWTDLFMLRAINLEKVRILDSASTDTCVPTVMTNSKGSVKVRGTDIGTLAEVAESIVLGSDITTLNKGAIKSNTLTSLKTTAVTSVLIRSVESSTLTDMDFANTLTTIGANAFQGCTALKKISFKEGLTTVSSRAFAYSVLEHITFPSGVTSVGDYIFDRCIKIQDITFLGTTPPTFSGTIWFGSSSPFSGFKIYVPDGCVDAYKAAVPSSYAKYVAVIPDES